MASRPRGERCSGATSSRRSAYAAGAAGVAASLPLNLLLGEVARSGRRWPRSCRRPSNMPIDHFVVLMMENRSFDHYFGWLPDADARPAAHLPGPGQRRRPGRDPPRVVARERAVAGLRPPRPGPRLGRTAARSSAARGRTRRGAGRIPGRRQRRVRALLLRRGRPRLHPPRRARVHRLRPVPLLADGPDLAEPLLHVVGAVGRQDATTPRRPTRSGNQWETRLRPRARDRGSAPPATTTRTCRSPPSGARAGRPGRARWPSTTPTARPARCPNITFVDPPFRDGGGGDGISADEHPLGDVRLGQAFMSDVVHAFIESPLLGARRALHRLRRVGRLLRPRARRRACPTRGSSANIDDDFGLMGFRIPAVAISPFAQARRGQPPAVRLRVDHQADHLPLRARAARPRATRRRRTSASSMNWTQAELRAARTCRTRIASSRRPAPLGGGDVLDSQETHASDLAALEDLADRFGIPDRHRRGRSDLPRSPTRSAEGPHLSCGRSARPAGPPLSSEDSQYCCPVTTSVRAYRR